MTGQAHWLTLVILLVSVAPVAYLWLRGRMDDRKYRVEKTHARCRQRGNRLAKITLARDRRSGAPVGILECDGEPGLVRCNRACLRLFAH
jgi:hypothetical protein